MQLSAVLGHPDQPHFPDPSPHHPHPPPFSPPFPSHMKKKSPSQLRRQERRQQEVRAAEAAVPTVIIEETEKDLSDEVLEAEINNATVKIVENPAEDASTTFKCDQCAYTNLSEKGLKQHTRMKHRISQVDGTHDEEELENINCVAFSYKVMVTDKKNVKDIENDLESFSLWDNIKLYHFLVVEEGLDNFNVEVTCNNRGYPEDFSVPWAVSQLKSLPRPQGYSVICSQGPSYPT